MKKSKGKQKATTFTEKDIPIAVRLQNEAASKSMREWIQKATWQEESTFLITCYMKGSRPLSDVSDEELDRIIKCGDDEAQLENLALEIGFQYPFQDDFDEDEFDELLQSTDTEDGNTRLIAIRDLEEVTIVRCRTMYVFEGKNNDWHANQFF